MNTDTPTLEILAREAEAVPVPDNATPERFAITWATDVYQASEPLAFLVQGLITKGSVNLLVGEGGSKKPWAALDLAVCAATGKDWLDFPLEQTTVLIVDEDSGPRCMRRRLYEVLNGHLVPQNQNAPIALTSLNMMDLRNKGDVCALQAMIDQTGAGLVIIDALADVMPGADENAVKDVQPLFANLRQVAVATQAAIIVIHHSNKQNNGYRGSTVIRGKVDLMLMVESKSENKFIEFSTDKTRHIEHKTFTAVANFSPEQFWLSASDPQEKIHLNKGQRFVLRYLLENGNSEKSMIANAADVCEPTTARNAIYSLVDKGYVERTNEGSKGATAEYNLTEEGRGVAGRLE